jgi:hypothetical protein
MNPAKTPENLESQLRAFQEEIAGVILAELDIEKGSMKQALNGAILNPQELTSVDMIIWQKIKDVTITPDDLNDYAREFEKVEGAIKEDLPDVPATRKFFRSIVNGRATSIIADRLKPTNGK